MLSGKLMKEMGMKKLTLALAALASVAFATPAMAIDFGIALGSGQSSSSSLAVAGSQGSSGSLLFGITGQQSSAGAASGGEATSVMSGNDQLSSSIHQSETTQQGTSGSLGLAGSQNSNFAFGAGGSNASNQLVGVWLFVQP